jgi:hypothetical protein
MSEPRRILDRTNIGAWIVFMFRGTMPTIQPFDLIMLFTPKRPEYAGRTRSMTELV